MAPSSTGVQGGAVAKLCRTIGGSRRKGPRASTRPLAGPMRIMIKVVRITVAMNMKCGPSKVGVNTLIGNEAENGVASWPYRILR